MSEPINDIVTFERCPNESSTNLLFSLACIAGGIWFVASPSTFVEHIERQGLVIPGVPTEYVVTLLGLGCIAIGCVVFHKWMIHRGSDTPAVELRPSGITIRVSIIELHDHPWTNIECAFIGSYKRVSMLFITFYDPELVSMNHKPLTRFVHRINRIEGTPVYISENRIRCDLDVLADSINRYKHHVVDQAS